MRNLAPPPQTGSAALELDSECRTASVGGDELYLTDREFTLLEALHAAAGRPLSEDELLGDVFAGAPGVTRRVLDALAKRLERKLELRGAGLCLGGEPSIGLSLQSPGEESGQKGGRRWAPIC